MPFISPKDIRLISLDVDGVLTDGGLYVLDDGTPLKKFHVADGLGIRLAMQAGIEIVLLTGKTSHVVAHRASELGIKRFIQGSKDKASDLMQMCQELNIDPSETAHLGDDLIDLPAFHIVGYPMAVANACDEVKDRAAYITDARGGEGAAREAIEHILKAKGLWEGIVNGFIRGKRPNPGQ